VPLIAYYQEMGLLIEVDGEGEVADITERVNLAVQQLSEVQTAGAAQVTANETEPA
jgi:hypothetical protein